MNSAAREGHPSEVELARGEYARMRRIFPWALSLPSLFLIVLGVYGRLIPSLVAAGVALGLLWIGLCLRSWHQRKPGAAGFIIMMIWLFLSGFIERYADAGTALPSAQMMATGTIVAYAFAWACQGWISRMLDDHPVDP